MTITDIIENLEEAQENIEECTQIPKEIKYEIISHLTAASESLSDCADEYGDDSDDSDNVEEDSDEW